MGNLARFSINLIGSTTPGYDAAWAEVLSCKLEYPSGVVQRWTLQVFGTENEDAPAASLDAPLLTLHGITDGEKVDAVTISSAITTTLPSGAAHSWKFRSLVNGGLDALGRPHRDYVFERVISIRSAEALRKWVDEEATAYDQRGIADAQNEMIDAITGGGGGGGGGGLVVTGTPQVTFVPTWTGGGAEWQPQGGLKVLSFGINSSLYETGQTVANPSFSASYNVTPTAAVLTNNLNAESKDVHLTPTSFASSVSYQRSTPNQSVTWTLTTTNGTATTTATWGQKNFWGVSSSASLTEAFVEGLASSQLSTSRNASVSVNPTGTQKIYYACPARYGTPTFTAGGFVGGFILYGSVNVTNAQGFTESYNIYESAAAGLGSTLVAVS